MRRGEKKREDQARRKAREEEENQWNRGKDEKRRGSMESTR